MPREIFIATDLLRAVNDVLSHSITLEEFFESLPESLKGIYDPGRKYLELYYGTPIFGEILAAEDSEDKLWLASRPDVRMVRASSVMCREGEMGTVFVLMMLPISDARYEEAKVRRWEVSPSDAIQWVNEEIDCLNGF